MSLGVVSGSTTFRQLRASAAGVEAEVWRRISRNRRKLVVPSLSAGVPRVRKGNFALLLQSTESSYLADQPPCDLRSLDQFVSLIHYMFVVRKGSPLVSELNHALQTLQQEGSLQQLYHTWWSGDQCITALTPKSDDALTTTSAVVLHNTTNSAYRTTVSTNRKPNRKKHRHHTPRTPGRGSKRSTPMPNPSPTSTIIQFSDANTPQSTSYPSAPLSSSTTVTPTYPPIYRPTTKKETSRSRSTTPLSSSQSTTYGPTVPPDIQLKPFTIRPILEEVDISHELIFEHMKSNQAIGSQYTEQKDNHTDFISSHVNTSQPSIINKLPDVSNRGDQYVLNVTTVSGEPPTEAHCPNCSGQWGEGMLDLPFVAPNEGINRTLDSMDYNISNWDDDYVTPDYFDLFAPYITEDSNIMVTSYEQVTPTTKSPLYQNENSDHASNTNTTPTPAPTLTHTSEPNRSTQSSNMRHRNPDSPFGGLLPTAYLVANVTTLNTAATLEFSEGMHRSTTKRPRDKNSKGRGRKRNRKAKNKSNSITDEPEVTTLRHRRHRHRDRDHRRKGRPNGHRRRHTTELPTRVTEEPQMADSLPEDEYILDFDGDDRDTVHNNNGFDNFESELYVSPTIPVARKSVVYDSQPSNSVLSVCSFTHGYVFVVLGSLCSCIFLSVR